MPDPDERYNFKELGWFGLEQALTLGASINIFSNYIDIRICGAGGDPFSELMRGISRSKLSGSPEWIFNFRI